MTLDWLAERHDEPAVQAARKIEGAVDRAFAAGLKPCEFGGPDGTAMMAVMKALDVGMLCGRLLGLLPIKDQS